MRKQLVIGAMALMATIILPGAAFADTCVNVSRPGTDATSGPVIQGNWAYLPSLGVPVDGWGFAPPGGDESVANNLPGANGNYTNGKSESLLGVSAICTGNGQASTNRQTSHGIQSGCDQH